MSIHLGGEKTFDLTIYQALMIVLAITGLAVGALVEEQQRTERQLRIHQDALARVSRLGSMGELAAALAHEINQPLTAIGNYTRMLHRAADAKPQDVALIKEAAAKASEQVDRAADVVRRLREFIRMGRCEMNATAVALIVADAAELSRVEFERLGVELQTIVEPGLPVVNVDKLQIEQVVVNLLRNALEALGDAGRVDGYVTLSAARGDNGGVVISVRDNGPGFDPAIGQADFRPFATTKPNGMGLGLSLCKSIIDAHGGRLSIGGDRSGAIVSVELPVVTTAREVAT